MFLAKFVTFCTLESLIFDYCSSLNEDTWNIHNKLQWHFNIWKKYELDLLGSKNVTHIMYSIWDSRAAICACCRKCKPCFFFMYTSKVHYTTNMHFCSLFLLDSTRLFQLSRLRHHSMLSVDFYHCFIHNIHMIWTQKPQISSSIFCSRCTITNVLVVSVHFLLIFCQNAWKSLVSVLHIPPAKHSSI